MLGSAFVLCAFVMVCCWDVSCACGNTSCALRSAPVQVEAIDCTHYSHPSEPEHKI